MKSKTKQNYGFELLSGEASYCEGEWKYPG